MFSIGDTIAAVQVAVSSASGSAIAFLEGINNTIATHGENAIGTAVIGEVAIHLTLVAFLFNVSNTITAARESAVGTASVSASVRVTGAIIAFLILTGSVLSIDNTVAALGLAVSIATIVALAVGIIANLAEAVINNTITARGNSAVRAAGIGRSVGVALTPIASFVGVNNAIAAARKSAIGTASVGEGIRVVVTVVALLLGDATISPDVNVFLDSVTTAAVVSDGQLVPELLEESVLLGHSLEENSKDGLLMDAGILGSVVELNFEVETLIADVVFRGLVELDVLKDVGVALEREGATVHDGPQHLATSVEKDDGGLSVVNVRGVVQRNRTSSLRASLRQHDG